MSAVEELIRDTGWTAEEFSSLISAVRRCRVPVALLCDALTLSAEHGSQQAPLAQDQADFLIAHSGLGTGTRTVEEARVEQAAQALGDALALLGGALSPGEAAARLGVSPARVRRRVGEGSLVGYRVGRNLYLPRWEFTSSDTLPHLREVLRALPPGLPPTAIDGFFTSADADLGGSTRAAWLASGGGVGPVLLAAAGFGRW